MSETRNKNRKALLYCSVWPGEGRESSLEIQSIELQTYCLLNDLEVVDIISDVGPYNKGKLRSGMERLLTRVMKENIGHVIIHNVARIARESREAITFMRYTFDANLTEIHVKSWKLSTRSPECERALDLSLEILGLDHPNPNKLQVIQSDKLRLKPLWNRLFGMLQDERYAEGLIKAMFELKDLVNLTEKEYLAVHGGYDHLNMFRALGFRIKGEKTENTKFVADVLVRYWDRLKQHLGADVHKIIEGSESNALL